MRKRFLRHLLSVAVCSLWLHAAALAIPFSTYEYQEIRDVSFSITQKYPPTEYYYLGLGQSPTPLITFFQEISKDIAGNLPLSMVGALPEKTGLRAMDRYLFSHFKKFIPTPKQLAGRKILLIDYAVTGKGLIRATEYVQRYLKKTCATCQLKTLALVGTQGKESIPQLNSSGADIFPLKPFQLMEEGLIHQKFDQYSEFGTYYPHKLPSSEMPTQRSENIAYKLEIRGAMARDPEVKNRLSTLVLPAPPAAADAPELPRFTIKGCLRGIAERLLSGKP